MLCVLTAEAENKGKEFIIHSRGIRGIRGIRGLYWQSSLARCPPPQRPQIQNATSSSCLLKQPVCVPSDLV